MRRYGSLGALPLGGGRRVIAIGTFDGVHLGHQAIVARAIELARERGLPAMALTFEPQPVAVLRPELRPAVLTHLPLKTSSSRRSAWMSCWWRRSPGASRACAPSGSPRCSCRPR